MSSAQVVETSANVISNTHPDDRTLLNDMTPGFKPFTILLNKVIVSYLHQTLVGFLQGTGNI